MRSKEEILKSKKEPFFYVDDNSVDGDVNGVYDAMEEYADEKLGDFISKQNSFTGTYQVPKQILDQYAKEVAIEFVGWLNAKSEYFFQKYLNAKDNEELYPLTAEKLKFNSLTPEQLFNQFLQETKQDK